MTIDAVMRRIVWFSLLVSLLSSIPYSLAGCYQRRLCCPGRNNSCKAVDDGISHLPRHDERPRNIQQRRPAPKEYVTPYYEASGDGYDLVYPEVFEDKHHERIGKLILPDIVEMEGSGAEEIFARYAPTSSPKKTLTSYIFGQKTNPDEPPEEITRYSILSQHLPLRISTTTAPEDYGRHRHARYEPTTTSAPFYYLEATPVDCYCDETCVSLGDCCSDYTFVCPPRDCIVGDWSGWSGCVADKNNCGIGTQKRVRHERQSRVGGGAECPPLTEMRTCFVECKKQKSAADDITTVALLLDYKYNTTRQKIGRNNIYWDLPSVVEKYKKATFYCVQYSISWVNRNCESRIVSKGLAEGRTICAECQPEATLHRNNGRCASDLDDGDEGFWKLIGPKSCNGIWTRLNRTDNCRCSIDYPETRPFLLV